MTGAHGAVRSRDAYVVARGVERHPLRKPGVAGFAGETIPFTQTECSLVVGGAFSGLEGTVGAEREIDLSGALGVMPYACEGVATATEMTLTCTDDCPVLLVAE